MKARFFSSQPFVPRVSASIKGLFAVGLAILIALSSSLVNPVVAAHTTLGLPSVPVTLEAFNGTQSHFAIDLSNVPPGYDLTDGTYPGWCVDKTAEMTRSPAIHQVRLFSSYDPPGDLATQNWTMVNYILNHKQGNAFEIQEAIWYFVNFGTGYSPVTSRAWAIINDTLANGTDFIPRPGQTISIICYPVTTLPGGSNVQVTVIELTVPSLIGDVTGPDGQPDGKVDMRDIGFIGRYFGKKVPPAPSILDLNPDRKIDMRDISILAKHFGDQSL